MPAELEKPHPWNGFVPGVVDYSTRDSEVSSSRSLPQRSDFNFSPSPTCAVEHNLITFQSLPGI
eukprot:6295365-Amphidinium_carterae.1